MKRESVSLNKTPNFSNVYNAPVYGASDPYVAYTATQPVLFYRSFFSNISKDDVARTGVLPDVSLAAINNMANWTTKPSQEDFNNYTRLVLLAGGGNPGLISQDVERYAQERAIMGQGVAPYTTLNKVILENLTPEQIRKLAEENATEQELAANDPKALTDPETGQKYYLDLQGRKVPALKIGDKVISQKLLEPLSKTMLERGLLYRAYGSLKGGGLAPNLLAAEALKANEYLDPLMGNEMTRLSAVAARRDVGVEPLTSIEEQINDLLGDTAIAQYSSMFNPLDGSGIANDILKALEPTEDEKLNFNGVEWFKNSINPEVVPFLSQKGIDENLVRNARGHREALYFIQKELSTSTIQDRIQRYTKDAGFLRTNAVTNILYSLPTMIINDPDAALAIEITLGTKLLGAGVGMVGAGLSTIKRGADVVKNISRLSKISSVSKARATVKGLYEISMGDIPNWLRTSSTLRTMSVGAGLGALQNTGAEFRNQLNNIAWANTALLTDNTDEIKVSDLGWAALAGASFGGFIGGITSLGVKNYSLDTGRFIDQDGNEKSMIGSTLDQSTPITEGLNAAIEEMRHREVDNPPDILEQTNENIKDSGVVVLDQNGKSVRLQEDDIFDIGEIEPEKVMSGEYISVRDSRTNLDVLVRKDIFDSETTTTKPTLVDEEPKLNNLEKSVIETEKFADAADISTKAKIENGLPNASESTAFNRNTGESDSSYALRAINGGEVNTSADVLRLLSAPENTSRSVLKRLVDFKRRINSAKELLITTPHNKGEEWTKARIAELENLENTELKEAINKAMNSGDNSFTRLPETEKTKMISFVNEHAGKTDDQIEQLIKDSTKNKTFNRSQANMLRRRLKTPVTKETRKRLIEEILSDNSISNESRKILNTLLGTPENLTLQQRRLASGAYRKEKYFLKKASYLTGEFYLDVKGIINDVLNNIPETSQVGAKNNADLICALVRSALVNLRLPERAGLNRIEISLGNLKAGTLGSNKLVTKADGSTVLQLTLDSKTLSKALEVGDSSLIAHTILHELGHAYSYFATPKDILRMLTMYSEFLDPDVLEAFVKITEASKGELAVGVDMYTAINPGEVFANHFANQGLVTGLDAAAKLKLSFLEAFTTYVDNIIQGIADIFDFNSTTKLKLKRISKVINEVIENISETKPNAKTLIDMVKEERDFAESLRKASFYSTNKKEYQKNIIDLIKKHLPTPSEINDYNSGINSWLLGIEQGVYSYGSIGLNRGDRYTGISDQLIRNIQLANDDIKFPPYLDPIQTLDILLNPENTLVVQLAESYRNPDVIKNIVKTAELTSTRVGLERYLRTNNLSTLRSIDDLNAFIKTQGSYVSAGLNRYLSTFLFDLNRISENVFRLEELNSKAKQKSILRQNVFELSSGQQVFRPKFDTGLDDTSLVLYHGGTWTGGKAPNMLHSGTLKAAFDRTKHSLGSDSNYNIVAFEISKESNIIEMVDTGTNHVTFESYWDAIIQAYDNKPDLRFKDIVRDIIVDKKKADEVVTKLEEMYEEDPNLPPNSVDAIKTILKEAGVDIIKYKNVGEDIGSTSFVIVNPNSISIKANGKFEPDGTWAWRSRFSGQVLESTTRDLHDINYRGSESLQNLIKVLPDLRGLESDFSEAIGVQKEVEFKPTSITEVTPETKPLLEQELNNLLIKIEGFKPSFFRRLAGAVRATTTLSISPEDAKSTLTDVWIKGREQLERNEIPDILKLKTEKSIFASVVNYKKFASFKELEARAKGGKVGELDAFEDVDVIAGQANKNNETIDGEATDIDALRKRLSDFSNFLNNNRPIFSGDVVNEIQELMRIRLEYSKLTKGFKAGKTPKLPAGASLELYFRRFPEERAVYNNYLKLKNGEVSPNMVEVLYGQDKNKIRLKKEDIITAYKDGYIVLLDPKNELVMGYIENNKLEATLKESPTTKIDEAIKQIKNKATALLTRVQKQEKIALEEFNDMVPSERPIHSEKILYDATLEKVAKSEDTALKTEETKQENIEKDSVIEEENQTTITAKEETPEVAAPILKGRGGDEMFTTSNILGDSDTMQLGVLFTTEKKAAGVRKKLNRKFTIRARINKSRVLRIVNNGESVFKTIKELPDQILRTAGINKSIMERVLGAVATEHSESEALRVLLHKLNEEGYTAVEVIDKSGKLIGNMPTAKEHVTIIDHVDHEEILGPKYTTNLPRKQVQQPIQEKNTIEVEPDPVLNPEELPVKIKDGEVIEKTQEQENGVSDVPQISEEERFVHSTLNATESLRWNGTTPKIIKIALLRFMKRAKELRENLGQPLTGVPVEFRNLLYRTLRAAESIAEENRTKFGDLYEQINDEFWTIFDREVSKELIARGQKGIDLSVKTINEIIDYSHQKLNENIKLRNQRDGLNLPEYTKPLKADDFDFIASSKTNKYPDTVVFKKGSIAEKMDILAEKKIKEAQKPTKTKPVIEEVSRQEIKEAVLESVRSIPVDNTMLLRESNFVGQIFGGSQRTIRNWWKKLMNGTANFIEGSSGTNVTTRSLSNIVRTVSAWADPSKAHIHHLVGGGKNALKSWEAISHEVYRFTKEIERAEYELIKAAPNEKIIGNIFVEVMKLFGSKKPLNKQLIENVLSSVIKNPDKALVDSVYSKTQKLYESIVSLNKKLLDLENETGWIELKDKDGNPIKPEEYFPITFVGERVLPSNRDAIIKELVRVRRETLIKSDDLSTDIMLSLGWLFDNSNDLTAGILDKGREVEGRKIHFLTEANFDKQTLINLEVNRYRSGTDAKTFAEFAGEASKKHFVYKDSTSGDLVVCRIPRKKTDLSLIDLTKYNEVLNGSTRYLGQQWKANFPGMPVAPLYTIMSEYLDSKLYQGRYSKEAVFRKSNPMNPMIQLRDKNRIEYGIAVKPLTWEEALSSETILGIMRSDPLEAYGNFVKARGFDLLLQKELDRLLGKKGIRFPEYLNILLQAAKEEAKALGATDEAIVNIEAGFGRLAKEVLAYKGMLSSVNSSYRSIGKESVEVGLSLVRGSSGLMWGITGTAESAQHLVVSPYTVGAVQSAKNLLETVRILVGDKRFSVSKAMQDELVDTIFFMDLVRGDLADNIINIDTAGVPKISRWFDRVKATREDSRFGFVSNLTDWFGNVGVEIGSSRYTTFLARKLAMQRFGKKIAKFINSGAAEKFFTELNSPAVKQAMTRLEQLAVTDVKAEQELFKIFKTLARKNGFGGDWEYALNMNKFGLNTVEKLKALKTAFNYLGKQYSKNGLINWKELRELFHENNKQRILTDVDGKAGIDAMESFLYAAETMTTTRGAIATTRGLGKDLSIESRTPMGRLLKSLLGWSQSFFSNVLGGYGSMTGSSYINMLILYTGLTAASEYLKEWVQGRDLEDIKTELKKDPQTYLFRMMMSTPVLGGKSGIITNTLSEISELTGGPLKAYNTLLSSPGYNIALSTPTKMIGGFKDLITEAIPSGDTAKMAQAVGATLGLNSLLNNSPIAIPARYMVEAGVINEADAMGKYMKLIRKKKNSYNKETRMITGSKAFSMDPQRKTELMRESVRKTRETLGNMGASSDLANQLEDMSNNQ